MFAPTIRARSAAPHPREPTVSQLEPTAAAELTAGDVRRVGAALEASIAPNTAKDYRAALGRFAKWLDGRPATRFDLAKVGRTLPARYEAYSRIAW